MNGNDLEFPVDSEYHYSGSGTATANWNSSSGSLTPVEYETEGMHQVSDDYGYVVGNSHSTDRTTHDSVNQSKGDSHDRVTTTDYRGSGDPVVTEKNSDNVWTHEETHHYVTRNTVVYDWGADGGSPWESRSDITGGDTWDGGADTKHGFISSDDPGEQPQVIDKDNAYGTGTITSKKTVTWDGVTTTIWDNSFPLTEYIGRRDDGTGGHAGGLSGDSSEVPSPTTRPAEASNQEGSSALDALQTTLSVGGVLDPTPICDGINTVISLLRGRWADALFNGILMLPYVGDAIGKGGKLVKKAVAETTEKVAEKAVARGAGRAIEEGAEKFTSKVARDCEKIGCFVAGTQVLMGDGSKQQIQFIQVGDRVATDGGVANSADGTAAADPNATAVDPDTWRLVTITVDDWQIQTLEPVSWIESHNLDAGDQIDLSQIVDVAEMGVSEGEVVGTVQSISDCPDIETCSGRIVLMTVSHLNSDVYTLTLTDSAGVTDNLGITATHRVYTEDRRWVQAQDLLAGETVQTATGTATVVGLVQEAGSYRVHNMTVEADHVYYVGDLSALVHNAASCTSGETAAAALGRLKHEAHAALADAQGYETKKALANGMIPDAFKISPDGTSAIVRELKPGNARAAARGLGQLAAEAKQISVQFGIRMKRISQILEFY